MTIGYHCHYPDNSDKMLIFNVGKFRIKIIWEHFRKQSGVEYLHPHVSIPRDIISSQKCFVGWLPQIGWGLPSRTLLVM
jgi:hypothetical protein